MSDLQYPAARQSRGPPRPGYQKKQARLRAVDIDFHLAVDKGASHPGTATSRLPFGLLTKSGTLRCFDFGGREPRVQIGIAGCISGFFQQNNEWACYRPNQFRCTCFFSVDCNPQNGFQYLASGSSTPLTVRRFFMTISAIDTDHGQPIDLVQMAHEREKGPSPTPSPVQLSPNFIQSQGRQFHVQHTFTRLRFEHKTENNGSRPATRQYCQLVITLLAETVEGKDGDLVKIAERRSERLTVHGNLSGDSQYPVIVPSTKSLDDVMTSPLKFPPQWHQEKHTQKEGPQITEGARQTGESMGTEMWKIEAPRRDSSYQSMFSHPSSPEGELRGVSSNATKSIESESMAESTSISEEDEEDDTCSVWMRARKRLIIDAVMRSLCRWLDSRMAATQNITVGQEGAHNDATGGSTPAADQTVLQGIDMGISSEQRPTKRRRINDVNNDNNGGGSGQKPKSGEVYPGNEPRRFACPYFKRDPRKYCQRTTCVGPGWVEVHRVKDHLYRRHALPPQCPRCWEAFKSEDLRDLHIQNDPPCQKRPNNTILDGFTKQQEKQLKSRKKSDTNMTAEGKWTEMYQILFPDDDPATIPDPYHDNISIVHTAHPSTPRTPAHFAAFARREYPRFVRRELEVLFDTEFQDVEVRVRPRVQELILGLQPRLIDLYEQSTSGIQENREGRSPGTGDMLSNPRRMEGEEVQPGQLLTAPGLDLQLGAASIREEVSTEDSSLRPSEAAEPDLNIDWSFLDETLFNYTASNLLSSQQQQDVSRLATYA